MADLDRDGRIDIVVNNLGGRASLLWNESSSSHHWLAFRLRGPAPNRFAVGAKVTLSTSKGSQTREVQCGGGYLSHNDLTLHFGLGSAQSAERVEVRWPNGERTVLGDVAANRIVDISQAP